MKMNFDNENYQAEDGDNQDNNHNNLNTGRSVDDSSGLIEDIPLGEDQNEETYQKPDIVPKLFLQSVVKQQQNSEQMRIGQLQPNLNSHKSSVPVGGVPDDDQQQYEVLNTGSAKKLIRWNDNNYIENTHNNLNHIVSHQYSGDTQQTQAPSQDLFEDEVANTPQALLGPRDDDLMQYATNNKLLWNHSETEEIDEQNVSIKGKQTIQTNNNCQFLYDEEVAEDEKKLGRSRTANIPAPINGGFQLEQRQQKSQFGEIIELSPENLKMGKSGGTRKNKYLEEELAQFELGAALDTQKVMITSLQTESDQMQYTKRSALATERQTQKSAKANSSLFGSLNLSALRSARQIFPKSFQDLKADSQLNSARSLNTQRKQTLPPQVPRLQLKRTWCTIIANYKKKCMEGIFLKHLFCEAIPLKAYLVFMGGVDFFMAIVDSLSIYARGTDLPTEENDQQRIALTLAIVFFSIRLVFFVPILFFTLKLLFYTSKTGGKTLYGLKLTMFFLFLLFNIIGLGFLSDRGCTVMHTKLPSLESFTKMKTKDFGFKVEKNMRDSRTQNGFQEQQERESYDDCNIAMQLVEFTCLSIHYFISCWVILSVIHWIRRARIDPSSDFLNLISARTRNPIQLYQNQGRPLVREGQLQLQRGQSNPPRYELADDEGTGDDGSDEESIAAPVRLTSAQKSIHVNLKNAMKNLHDYRLDSQRNRLQKNKSVGSTIKKGARVGKKK